MKTSLRRNLEQARHCIDEALSALYHNEDVRHAAADVRQAETLLRETCLPELERRVDERKAAEKQAEERLPKYVKVPR